MPLPNESLNWRTAILHNSCVPGPLSRSDRACPDRSRIVGRGGKWGIQSSPYPFRKPKYDTLLRPTIPSKKTAVSEYKKHPINEAVDPRVPGPQVRAALCGANLGIFGRCRPGASIEPEPTTLQSHIVG